MLDELWRREGNSSLTFYTLPSHQPSYLTQSQKRQTLILDTQSSIHINILQGDRSNIENEIRVLFKDATDLADILYHTPFHLLLPQVTVSLRPILSQKGINLHFLSYFISLNMINLGFDFSLILQYLVIYSEIFILYIPSCHKLLQECSYIVQNIQGKHFFHSGKATM